MLNWVTIRHARTLFLHQLKLSILVLITGISYGILVSHNLLLTHRPAAKSTYGPLFSRTLDFCNLSILHVTLQA